MSSRPRQAVVLAAGRGSRMGASTDRHPKCLYPLAGKPILEWTLRGLSAQGVDRVLVIGGWCAEMLQPWAAELRVNAQWQTSNMVRSLMLASDWLQAEPTLVVYGDGAYGARALGTAMAPSEHDLLVPVDTCWLELWGRRFDDPLQDAETLQSREGLILSIGQRPQSLHEVQGQFMGMVRTTPRGWELMARHIERMEAEAGQAALDRLDMTSLLSRLVQNGIALHALEVAGGWVEIDSHSDAVAVEKALAEGAFSHDFRD